MSDNSQFSDPMNILEACQNSALFASWFRDRNTWESWFAFLAALFGLAMSPSQLEIYRACTGRTNPPTAPFQSATLICGRRAGKSFILALIAVFLSCFRDYRKFLQPGERATTMIIAADRKQARVIMRYIRGLLRGVPILERMVVRETAESFDLDNSVTIEINTASFRTTRGYSICCSLNDELAFWRSDDSAAPDTEILGALRPAMSTIPGSMMLCASSPYAQRGVLWSDFQRYHGQDGAPVLVWQAPTRTMNSTVPQSIIDEAAEKDPAFAQSEYYAQFRTDVQTFLEREAVLACVEGGLRERPPERRWQYIAAVDPASGSGGDSMTLAICHKTANTVVLDAVREVRPKFSPETVCDEFSALCKQYRITRVHGDRWAGGFSHDAFRRFGVNYTTVDKPKSEYYLQLAPLINSQAIDLLHHDKLVQQLVGLERKTARSGRDTIDHGPGQHDDIANSVAIAAALAQSRRYSEPGLHRPTYKEYQSGRRELV
jgi:hypothetical protein